MYRASGLPLDIPLVMTVTISRDVLLEILNVAIHGACESWADVCHKESGEYSHVFAGATFRDKGNRCQSVTVHAEDIATGIQRVLSENFPVSSTVRTKLLRVIAYNDVTDIDAEVADSVVRALVLSTARSVEKITSRLREEELLAAFRRLSEFDKQVVMRIAANSA